MRSIATLLVILGFVALATAQTYTHSQALSKLQAAGISVRSSGGCSNRNNPRCTSLDGIHTQCIDGSAGVITLKRSSGCACTITGGTEVGHAPGTYSHGNGWKLDVSMNSCLTSYIKGNFASIGNNRWRSSSGNVYYYEGDHWDITYHP
eukprot:TRINITY_DN3620_c0_g1_i1.p1 TRINITY_DN3620_c0_g1~~TRINITY_DN3620_c0_g1_i1.p1  ORF type:complete len:149 (-),score=29.80 TRINITY_DN3620_c0_g1_i1:120-566(-)